MTRRVGQPPYPSREGAASWSRRAGRQIRRFHDRRIFHYDADTSSDQPVSFDFLPPSRVEAIYTALRQEVKREDDLINQRNTWCILSTTVLAAGIGVIFDKISIFSTAIKLGTSLGLALAGFSLALYCCRAVAAARKQIEYLFTVYHHNRTYLLDNGYFRPFGEDVPHRDGIGYSQVTPLIMLYIWSSVITTCLAALGYLAALLWMGRTW